MPTKRTGLLLINNNNNTNNKTKIKTKMNFEPTDDWVKMKKTWKNTCTGILPENLKAMEHRDDGYVN